jgi:hypothetical protein
MAILVKQIVAVIRRYLMLNTRGQLLFESIPFAFPTHIIFRDSQGSPLEASLQ